jgi:hypothetical protein
MSDNLFAGVDATLEIVCPVCTQLVYRGKMQEAAEEHLDLLLSMAKRKCEQHMAEQHQIPYWQELRKRQTP